ncbi:MAG: O-antigen ligase family protein [candidate division Zixibacteria bacterium]|nr:O-antigen ligase family protein [candidate division Zixibacteria bacterium]
MSKEKWIKAAEKSVWFSLCGFAFFSPWSVAGAQTAITVGLLAWLAKMLFSGRVSFVRTPLNLPIFLYVITLAISVIFSPFKAHSFLAFKEEWLLLIFFLIVNNVKEEAKVEKLLTIFISISVLVGLYAICQHYFGVDLYRNRLLEPRGGVFISLGLFGHHLTFGGYYMLVFLLASVILLNAKRAGVFRILDFLAPIVLGFSLVFSYARSAWLGGVMGILTFGFLKGGKFILFLVLGVFVLCLLIYVIEPTSWDRIKEIDFSKNKPESTRIRLWQTSINMIKDKPIWGIGLGNFGKLFNCYKVEGIYDTTCHPHNDFLNVAVNSGLLGLLAYLSVWAIFLYSTIKVTIKNRKTGFGNSVQMGGIVAIVAFLFASLFQCYYTDAEVNMLIMFILGLTTVVNLKAKEEKP